MIPSHLMMTLQSSNPRFLQGKCTTKGTVYAIFCTSVDFKCLTVRVESCTEKLLLAVTMQQAHLDAEAAAGKDFKPHA